MFIQLVIFLDFDNDYVLSEEDNESLNFIMHSYEYAVVADIAGIPLTVKFLHPHVYDRWLYDTASYFDYRSVITNPLCG